MQGHAPTQGAPLDYDAFLSYAHSDRPVAVGIQRGLQRIGRRAGQLRALRVFRDDTDLAASPDLWGILRKALVRSRYMVVVLSPRTASSLWVDKEVNHWLEQRGAERLMLVLADGQLQWDEHNGCFDPQLSTAAPPVLTEPGSLPSQPLWIDVSTDEPWDLRERTFRDKVTALAAVMHGKPKDELVTDELREQRRFLLFRTIAVAALAMSTVLLALIVTLLPQRSIVTGSAILGVLGGAVLMWFVASNRRSARRGRRGLLAIQEAIDALAQCDPKEFHRSELRNRRKVNNEIDRIAVTIEGIPAAMKIRHPTVIRAATERGAGIRALQVRMASLTEEGRQKILDELEDIKTKYDSGSWLDIPAVGVEVGFRPTFASRILWIAVAVITFTGIVAMEVLSAKGFVPQSVSGPAPFVLGLILVAALARSGFSVDVLKNAVDVTGKVTSDLGKPAKEA
jgi:hypothetical protein